METYRCLFFVGGEEVASAVTQIWYSLRLSDMVYRLVISKLQELVEASSLEELTKGTMKMNQGHFQRLVEVWRTWLDLSSRQEDWITEARNKRFKSFDAQEGMDLYLKEIPKKHKESASDWFANGILSPKESRKELLRENFTLTGSDFQLNRNKGAFSYLIQSSVLPFAGWDYNEVRQWGQSASLLKMYSEYVSHLLKKSALKLATGRVKFHFLLCNCMEIARFVPQGSRFDRVTTSNIADFVPLPSILDTYKPLLNVCNPFSVIITEFLNWSVYTDVKKELLERAHFMPKGDSFRQKVLEDTKNPAIAYSRAYQSLVEYHDHSGKFLQFLRAAVLVSRPPDEGNRRRTWKSVADYNGLVARDFNRCQNRVFPAKWMLNCRRVSLLNGFERAVEWIIHQ